jgi:FixJ family two-component response regulator
VVSGRLNKQIAAEIGTGEAAAKVHRSQLMRKMRADSLPQLVRMAEKMGIQILEQSRTLTKVKIPFTNRQ